jgi:hypothetical protein
MNFLIRQKERILIEDMSKCEIKKLLNAASRIISPMYFSDKLDLKPFVTAFPTLTPYLFSCIDKPVLKISVNPSSMNCGEAKRAVLLVAPFTALVVSWRDTAQMQQHLVNAKRCAIGMLVTMVQCPGIFPDKTVSFDFERLYTQANNIGSVKQMHRLMSSIQEIITGKTVSDTEWVASPSERPSRNQRRRTMRCQLAFRDRNQLEEEEDDLLDRREMEEDSFTRRRIGLRHLLDSVSDLDMIEVSKKGRHVTIYELDDG